MRIAISRYAKFDVPLRLVARTAELLRVENRAAVIALPETLERENLVPLNGASRGEQVSVSLRAR